MSDAASGHVHPEVASVTPGAVSVYSLHELIGRSDLIQHGQALLVSLVPVKEALGPRWEARRTQIYDLVERYFRKHLSPEDLWEQAGETHVLVATPGKSPMLAQALCYRAIKEVLTYFLGEVRAGDLNVSLVTHLSAGQVEVRRYSVAELEKADAESEPRPPPPEPPASSLSNLTSWPLQTSDGQNLRVSFAVEPVLDLRAWAMAGHRIESRIMNLQTGVELSAAQRRNLLPRDFEQIDMAALERGMSRLAGGDVPDKPKLIIQLSFASLSNGRARAALLDRAKRMQDVLRHAAICELVDIEPGLPEGRLSEITSLIRNFFRGVWVQVTPQRSLLDAASGARTSGLCVRAADLGVDARRIARGMDGFATMLTGRKTLLVVTSLPNKDLMMGALAAGFTHATLRGNA